MLAFLLHSAYSDLCGLEGAFFLGRKFRNYLAPKTVEVPICTVLKTRIVKIYLGYLNYDVCQRIHLLIYCRMGWV